MINSLKTKKGFTLAETSLTVFLFSFVLLGMYSIMLAGNNSYYMNSNYVDLEQQARKSVDKLVRELRSAKSSSIAVTTLSGSNDKVTFSTNSVTNAKYYLNTSNQLIREYPSGTNKVVAVNITYLKFVLSGSLLTINLKAEKNFFRLLSIPYKAQVKLRNG